MTTPTVREAAREYVAALDRAKKLDDECEAAYEAERRTGKDHGEADIGAECNAAHEEKDRALDALRAALSLPDAAASDDRERCARVCDERAESALRIQRTTRETDDRWRCEEGRVLDNEGEGVPCPEERDFVEACGATWAEPEDRK